MLAWDALILSVNFEVIFGDAKALRRHHIRICGGGATLAAPKRPGIYERISGEHGYEFLSSANGRGLFRWNSGLFLFGASSRGVTSRLREAD